MALYDLARGGRALEYGNGCKSCDCTPDENGLPPFLQPDHRDGYHFRDKRTWQSLLNDLDKRYGKSVTDLEVGDKLRIFYQPNFADVKSIFVDFRQPAQGFQFKLVSVNGADYATGKVTKTEYSQCGGVENVSDVAEIETGANDPYTQYILRVEDGFNAKVEAIDLEIVAIPSNPRAFETAEMLFARRFEVEGYFMPSAY